VLICRVVDHAHVGDMTYGVDEGLDDRESAIGIIDPRVLVIVPDATRTAPVGLLFKSLFQQIGEVTAAFDILIALGTHQPMSNAAICQRLEITEAEWRSSFRKVRFFNHAWDNPEALGTMRLVRADLAEFRQNEKLAARFTPAPRGWKSVTCD